MTRGNRRQRSAETPAGGGRKPVARDSQFVSALARGLRLMGCFRPGDEFGVSNSELAKRSGLAQPTVSRLAYTLLELGYLTYNRQTGHYQLGPAILTLSYVMLGNMNIGRLARPIMRRFVDETDVTVGLNVYSQHRMTVIEGISGSSPVALRLDVGTRIPVATTAAGRAYLAGLEPDDRATLMVELEAASSEGDWRRTHAAIEKAEADVRTLGFCISIGEWRDSVNAAAVPLLMSPASAVFSLSCGGSAHELPKERILGEIGPKLASMAREIERAIES
jgi:DNA-binding IclR family transcriptional regulator